MPTEKTAPNSQTSSDNAEDVDQTDANNTNQQNDPDVPIPDANNDASNTADKDVTDPAPSADNPDEVEQNPDPKPAASQVLFPTLFQQVFFS